MKHAKTLVITLAFLIVGAVAKAQAQVKTVEMKIAGYLCGN
jgi:hypothetical protein